ncbi:MAG: hypothetical protein OXE76_05915 [Alphaproteobacteria bacterium]|nr:hypothetical protein [Alphaproteobacteria bacterium]
MGLEWPRYLDGTNIGGAAFVLHAGGGGNPFRPSGGGAVRLQLAPEKPSRPDGLPFPVGAYTMAAQCHAHVYGSTRKTLAEIAVATRAWTALNPAAAFREPMTVNDVLGARMIASPLGRYDCCLVTDSGGAVVMATEERARDLRTPPVHVLGHCASASHISIAHMPDMAKLEAAERSSRRAYIMAGSAEIDLAMLYSFTVTMLMTLETLCGYGREGLRQGRADRRRVPGQHQWRRTLLLPSGHVRAVHHH